MENKTDFFFCARNVSVLTEEYSSESLETFSIQRHDFANDCLRETNFQKTYRVKREKIYGRAQKDVYAFMQLFF